MDQLRTLGYFIDKNGVKSTELEKKYNKAERKEMKEKAQKEKENAEQSKTD